MARARLEAHVIEEVLYTRPLTSDNVNTGHTGELDSVHEPDIEANTIQDPDLRRLLTVEWGPQAVEHDMERGDSNHNPSKRAEDLLGLSRVRTYDDDSDDDFRP